MLNVLSGQSQSLLRKKTFRQGMGIYRNSGIQSMEGDERSQRWHLYC